MEASLARRHGLLRPCVHYDGVGDLLFGLAQCLFMVLPLMSLYAKRDGKPTELHPPQRVAMSCGILAFTLLVAKFSVDFSSLGLSLCAANLGLRLAEAARAKLLHDRIQFFTELPDPDRSLHSTGSSILSLPPSPDRRRDG